MFDTCRMCAFWPNNTALWTSINGNRLDGKTRDTLFLLQREQRPFWGARNGGLVVPQLLTPTGWPSVGGLCCCMCWTVSCVVLWCVLSRVVCCACCVVCYVLCVGWWREEGERRERERGREEEEAEGEGGGVDSGEKNKNPTLRMWGITLSNRVEWSKIWSITMN